MVTFAGMPVRVKWGKWQGRLVSVAAEYEDAAAAARASGEALREVMGAAAAAARELLAAEGPVAPGANSDGSYEERPSDA